MGGLSEIGGLSDRLVMMTQMALMEWEDGVCGMYRLDITCSIVSECRPFCGLVCTILEVLECSPRLLTS